MLATVKFQLDITDCGKPVSVFINSADLINLSIGLLKDLYKNTILPLYFNRGAEKILVLSQFAPEKQTKTCRYFVEKILPE